METKEIASRFASADFLQMPPTRGPLTDFKLMRNDALPLQQSPIRQPERV